MDTREIWYLNDPTSRETFVQSRYDEREQAIGLLFSKHGLYISSGLRPNKTGSLHEVQSGGLGFDGSAGPNTPENIAKERACGEDIRDNPKLRVLFQEVVAHDVSPNQDGYHIHAAFVANLENVLEKMQAALGKDWFEDMATKKDLREVVKEEVGKAENRLRKEIHKARRMTAVGADENYPTKNIHLKKILNKLDKA